MKRPASFELRGVSMAYGNHAVLANCNFLLPKSQHTALLGRSGCGKSTILRLLAGLEPPTGGEVLIDDAPASVGRRTLVPPHARGVAMVFQDLGLWPALSALDNVLLGLDGSGLPREQRRIRATAALRRCGMEDLASRLPGTLSGGQQQRVALARAIAIEPALLLLDEAFAGLDWATKSDLLTDLGELVAARDLTILLVSHDPMEALTLCTHAVVLDGGRITEAGSWHELLVSPRSALLRAFQPYCRARAPA